MRVDLCSELGRCGEGRGVARDGAARRADKWANGTRGGFWKLPPQGHTWKRVHAYSGGTRAADRGHVDNTWTTRGQHAHMFLHLPLGRT